VKVLVIDDNTAVLEVVALMLTSDGHTVATAGGGRDALARLEAGETADLVLTDLEMPEMSGWQVVQAVRSRWPTVRVGLMTGALLSFEEQREPVDMLLPKPMTLEQLRGAVPDLGSWSFPKVRRPSTSICGASIKRIRRLRS
jgi:CheY-like chemotaxis protein